MAGMARNIEIKARVDDLAAVQDLAEALADGPAETFTQDDTFFAVPAGRLKLRVFADGTGQLIHYQRADEGGPKLSDYVITPVAEPDSLREALTRACGQLGRVRKQRTLLLAGQTRIHLDRVEGLGDHLELEVVLRDDQTIAAGQSIALDLMGRLQVPSSALLTGAYLDMLRQRAAATRVTAASP